jgi:hypothetical protein
MLVVRLKMKKEKAGSGDQRERPKIARPLKEERIGQGGGGAGLHKFNYRRRNKMDGTHAKSGYVQEKRDGND